MAEFTEKQQHAFREVLQYLVQCNYHLSHAVLNLTQAMEMLKPFQQNLSLFEQILTDLKTFIIKIKQTHKNMEYSLPPSQVRQPKITIQKESMISILPG